MRLLVLGGTQFLGRAIAANAIDVGYEVTCAARGTAGPVARGARLVEVDRDATDGLQALEGMTFDAVVDVSRHPGQVRRAIASLRSRARHWSFVSTVSVYADNRTPGQSAGTAALLAPTAAEVESSDFATYGAAKVACELAVGENAFICRAGLIVGPEDPTGRFSYWPARIARGGEVVAPGSPDDPVQFVDVRDLARWIVRAAERELVGTYDGVGPTQGFGEMLSVSADALGATCTFTWLDRAFLEAREIRRWAGPRSLPLWLPQPDYGGFTTRNARPAREAGLVVRPLSETVRDTADWLDRVGGKIDGLDASEESSLLAAFHEAHGVTAP